MFGRNHESLPSLPPQNPTGVNVNLEVPPTDPSEWTTKPDYQIKKTGAHSDWAAQDTYATYPDRPAHTHLYFDYPGLEDYWSAEESGVPEPYVAAAYIKWFVSSWESAYDKNERSDIGQSTSLEDIAAAVKRHDPGMLKVLSQCATDHHNVAEISRDSVSKALKDGKEKGKPSASVVPYAIQHLVEILPNTRSDFRLSDRASVQDTKRLKANSHAAGARSSLDPKNPKREVGWGRGKRKNHPDEVIHQAEEQVSEASDKFAKLAFRNGRALSKSVADAVANNTQEDYDRLPDYVGSPPARSVNYKDYQYELAIKLDDRELTINVDPIHDRVTDSLGSTLVRYDKGQTVLCFSAGKEVIIDESLGYEEAMIMRVRYREDYRATGKLALLTEAPAVAPNDFVHSHSDIATKAPLLSRAITGSPLISSDVNVERDEPKKLLDVRLTNGEVLQVFNDGTTRLNNGIVISRRVTSGKDGGVFTAIEVSAKIEGPDKPLPLITKEVLTPLSAYKNYMRLNRDAYPGIQLNNIWRVGGNETY